MLTRSFANQERVMSNAEHRQARSADPPFAPAVPRPSLLHPIAVRHVETIVEYHERIGIGLWFLGREWRAVESDRVIRYRIGRIGEYRNLDEPTHTALWLQAD